MNVGKFSKHENKSSYSHRDKGKLLTKRVSQISVYAVKSVFQLPFKLKIAKNLIVLVLSSSYYVTRFEVGYEWKATGQRRVWFSKSTVLYLVTVNHEWLVANNIASKCWFMRTFPTHASSQIISHFSSKNMSHVRIARLDSSFAKYSFTLCVTLQTLIVIEVSLWLFLSCMRVFRASTISYGGIQSRFKMVRICCFG